MGVAMQTHKRILVSAGLLIILSAGGTCGQQWNKIKAFPETVVTGGTTVHGLAVDGEGKLWVQFWGPLPGDSVVECSGLATPVRGIYVYNPDGSQASFSPIHILSGNGVQDTLFSTPTARSITNRGLTRDH